MLKGEFAIVVGTQVGVLVAGEGLAGSFPKLKLRPRMDLFIGGETPGSGMAACT
jgi:hypothetical protein